jgi:hypothetical protein
MYDVKLVFQSNAISQTQQRKEYLSVWLYICVIKWFMEEDYRESGGLSNFGMY